MRHPFDRLPTRPSSALQHRLTPRQLKDRSRMPVLSPRALVVRALAGARELIKGHVDGKGRQAEAQTRKHHAWPAVARQHWVLAPLLRCPPVVRHAARSTMTPWKDLTVAPITSAIESRKRYCDEAWNGEFWGLAMHEAGWGPWQWRIREDWLWLGSRQIWAEPPTDGWEFWSEAVWGLGVPHESFPISIRLVSAFCIFDRYYCPRCWLRVGAGHPELRHDL